MVTLSTYAFFAASVFGRQHINPPKYPDLFLTQLEHRGEYYIPVFTILQFLLYMGLLKMGEQLINPFGDDDEDSAVDGEPLVSDRMEEEGEDRNPRRSLLDRRKEP